MKTLWSKLTGRLPAWVITLISVVTCVITLIMGGSTTQDFTSKTGAEYQVKLVIPDGVLELIEKCDLKKVGDECPVSISVTARMTKEPSSPVNTEAPATGTPEPVKTEEPVKTLNDIKKEEPVKIETDKGAIHIKEVPVSETKPVQPVK